MAQGRSVGGGVSDHTKLLNIGTRTHDELDAALNALSNVANKSQQFFHGFTNRTGSSLAFNAGTRTFTLTHLSDYIVYVGGVPLTITASKTVVTGTGLGTHFIWMAADSSLATSQTPFDILDTTITPVATIHWDGTGSPPPGDERHDYRRNLIEHNNQHQSWGAQYVSGFTPTPTFADANTFSFLGGVVRDEELYHTYAGAQTTCIVGHRVVGAASMTFNAASTGYAKLNAGTPQYDNAGTLTNLGVAKYGKQWVYATNYGTLVSIVGQGEHSSVAAAQAAPQPTLPGLSVAEWKLLYRVIIQNVAGALKFVQADVMYNLSTGPAIQAGAVTTIPAGNVTTVGTYPNVQSYIEALEAAIAAGGGGGKTIVIKTGNFTAENGFIYKVNTSGGAISVQFPPVADGIDFELIDYASTWATNKVTCIPATGERIQKLPINETLVLNASDDWFRFTGLAAATGWGVDHGGLNSGNGIDASGFNGNLATTDSTIQKVAQKVDDLPLLTLSSFVALGVKSVDFSVTRVAGTMTTCTSVTTGSAAVAMTLVNPDPVTEYCKQVVAIQQGATARVITLKGTDANVVSGGGLLSSGDALPNSGANALDIFTFEWTGAKYIIVDAHYDVKS